MMCVNSDGCKKDIVIQGKISHLVQQNEYRPDNQGGIVELPGFEPGITGPESVVLPLHHSSVDFGDAKVGLYFSNAKKFPEFFLYICFNL